MHATSVATGVGRAAVSICIPAYEAEAFIARTLGFATGQTRRDIRILVSVDHSQDRTTEICRAIASADSRVEVQALEERAGWAGNVAALLRRVQTPYFFLYFHDDVISPHYCERLIAALDARPDAASAHCTVALLGRAQHLVPAHAYPVDTTARMLTMLARDQVPGAPLRSMIRTDGFDAAGLLRPGIGPAELHQAYCLNSAIMLAGPAIGVPENLYTRWLRDNSLTHDEESPETARVVAVWLGNLRRLWPVLAHRLPDPAALALVRHTLLLRAIRQIARAQGDMSGGLAALWRQWPELPRVEDAPPLDALDPGLAGALHRLRTDVAAALSGTPRAA